MKSIFLIVSILFCSNLLGQKFGELGTEWHNDYTVHIPGGGPGQGWQHTFESTMYKYVDDIVVGLDSFQVFSKCTKKKNSWNPNATYTNDSVYVFQDSMRVFYGSLGDMKLIYDFNLEVGDSVQYDIIGTTDSVYVIVSATDSVLVDGSWRKRIIFEDFNQNDPGMRWVEGVGDEIYGLFRTPILMMSDTHYLFCMKKNGVVLIGSCGTIHVCPPEWMSLESSDSKFETKVYPNPFSNSITIQRPIKEYYPQVKIYNSVGKIVYQEMVKTEIIEIDLSYLEPGVYFIHLSDDKGVSIV